MSSKKVDQILVMVGFLVEHWQLRKDSHWFQPSVSWQILYHGTVNMYSYTIRPAEPELGATIVYNPLQFLPCECLFDASYLVCLDHHIAG